MVRKGLVLVAVVGWLLAVGFAVTAHRRDHGPRVFTQQGEAWNVSIMEGCNHKCSIHLTGFDPGNIRFVDIRHHGHSASPNAKLRIVEQ